MNQGISNPNPTPQEENQAKKNVENDVKTISNRGTEPTDDEYYRAFGIPRQQQNQVSGNSSQGSGSNVELIEETNNSDTNDDNNDNKQNIQQNKNVKSKGNEEVVVNDQDKDQGNQVVNDIFSGDKWQSFLPNAENKQQIDQQNQQGSIESVADNSSSSDSTKEELKMPDPYDIAEKMGIEFKPDESLDKDRDSYKVMRKYEEEKNEYLINLSHAKSEQNRLKAEQEKNKKELFNRQAKKLAEYDQLFKNNDGTPNVKKISALVTAVSKLETSDDALILLRKYYNIATMPSIAKDQNSDKSKNDDNNQRDDNKTQFNSGNFLGNRQLPFNVGVSQEDINELNSFYGS